MKRIVSLFLLFVLTTTHAFAAISTEAPYPGDYIIAYNTLLRGDNLFDDAGDILRSELHPSDEGVDSFYSDDRAFAEFEVNPMYSRFRTSIVPFSVLPVGSTRDFRAFDLVDTTAFINVPSTLLSVGTYCYVWVKTSEVDSIGTAKADRLAEEFDQVIRPQIVENFGDYFSNEDRASGSVNGRIDILVYDIITEGPNVTLGYFNRADYLTSSDYISSGWTDSSTGTNGALLHINSIDIRGSEPIRQRAFETLAHEFQHLVNFTAATLAPSNLGTDLRHRRYMELWLNETLALAAQGMIYGPLNSRIQGYYYCPRVAMGGVLTYGSYTTNLNYVGANYGLPYLFSQYLRTQTADLPGGGNAIFKQILSSNRMGAEAVTTALSNVGYPVTDFPDLNRNFRIATFMNEPAGFFGFNSDLEIAHHDLRKEFLIYRGDYRMLRPSGAMILERGDKIFSEAGASANVKYAGFGGFNASRGYFLGNLYQNALGRDMEDAGRDFWRNGMEIGVENASTIIDRFFFGEEFLAKNTTDEQFVAIAHKTLMDQEPDRESMEFWLNILSSGYTRRSVLDRMVLDPKFAATCAEYGVPTGPVSGTEGFVARMYRSALGRRYDQEGLDFWVNGLGIGAETGASIAVNFFYSPEFLERDVTNEEFVAIAYNALKEREPNVDEMNHCKGLLDSGTDRWSVFVSILDSIDFWNICERYQVSMY